MMQLAAVAFDLDDTLWDFEPVLVRAEARLAQWLAEHCPRVPERYSLDEMRAARMQLARDEPHRSHDMTYLRRTTLARHARDCGYAEALADRALEVFLTARSELEPYPDVRPALARLASRYALATLSNGNADLGRIGLAGWFSVSLNACGVGAAKPHPRCFETLARELALPPGAILYVGDDPARDVMAARNAGFATAWMNRREAPWPGAFAPADLVVRDCHELVAALEALSRTPAPAAHAGVAPR